MDIRWLSAFIDQPASTFEEGTRFWQAVTGSGISPRRGDHEEFATLLPPNGDPYLRVQRTADGAAGVHLDLHVTDIAEATREAEVLGATLRADQGYSVMSSPAGFVFCLVLHHGEARVPDPFGWARPHTLDQLCIDVPAAEFETECAFWEALTGAERRVGSRDEFEYLVRDPSLPLRLLLQRLDGDDPGTAARGHLDFACGDHRSEVAADHERLGAEPIGVWEHWVSLRDPSGLPYCLTRREPVAP